LLFGINEGLPFYGGFAFSLAAALLAALFIPATASVSHRAESAGKVFSLKVLAPISAGALYGYLMSSLVTLFPLYLKSIGIEEVRMGRIVTSVIVGTLISQVPIGRAADRFGKLKTLLVCSITLAAIFALIPYQSRWGVFIAVGAILGALAGSLYPLGLSIIGDIVSKDRLGAATSLFSLAFGIGSLTGPALSGLAMRNLGNEWLFFLPTALTAIFCIQLSTFYNRS
jgi:MFS family permease